MSERLRQHENIPIAPVLAYHFHGIIFNVRSAESRAPYKEVAVIVSVLGLIREEYRGRSAEIIIRVLRAEERLEQVFMD